MKKKQKEKIKVTPEGREGLFLLDKSEAIKFIESLPQKEIHNFIGGSGVLAHTFLGCDWKKKDVIKFLNNKMEFLVDISGKREKAIVTKIAIMVLPDSETMKHQLVVLTKEKRYSFDVGVIEQKDLLIQK